jgi:hypothetical protein
MRRLQQQKKETAGNEKRMQRKNANASSKENVGKQRQESRQSSISMNGARAELIVPILTGRLDTLHCASLRMAQISKPARAHGSRLNMANVPMKSSSAYMIGRKAISATGTPSIADIIQSIRSTLPALSGQAVIRSLGKKSNVLPQSQDGPKKAPQKNHAHNYATFRT